MSLLETKRLLALLIINWAPLMNCTKNLIQEEKQRTTQINISDVRYETNQRRENQNKKNKTHMKLIKGKRKRQ